MVPEEVTVADEVPGASPSLNSDWGAQLAPQAEAPLEEMRMAEDEGPPAEEMPVLDAVVDAEPAAQTPSWLTMEANEASRAAEAPPADTGWVTESVSEVPLPAEAEVQPEQPLGATDARWDQAAQPVEALAQPETATEWVTQEGPPPEAEAAPLPTTPDDESWATGAQAEAAPAAATDEASWATEPAAEAPPADDASWANAPPAEAPPADDGSWANAPATEEAPLPTTPDDESWAVAPAQAQAAEPLPESQWATEQVAEVESISAAAPQPALDLPPAPEPSAPINITVEEPQDAPAPVAAPAGYAPMSPQRLVDLGASGSWVQEPGAGPFHISTDGLAVTVAGEMMVRMMGLVAIVGSVEVTPEFKRRRGRPSQEPFGTGASQLQRVTGNGVLYLEPGRSKFHAVDLTDQNGVALDDDGAYLREEMVFAFEEAIFYENGRLTAEGQSLDLAHLKGNGRVLLQLDGSLRAMPIPLGAPMVVPLHRVVGWFGRVSPRLMGFGGRGALELTGEGYALLGTPAESR